MIISERKTWIQFEQVCLINSSIWQSNLWRWSLAVVVTNMYVMQESVVVLFLNQWQQESTANPKATGQPFQNSTAHSHMRKEVLKQMLAIKVFGQIAMVDRLISLQSFKSKSLNKNINPGTHLSTNLSLLNSHTSWLQALSFSPTQCKLLALSNTDFVVT